MLEGSKKANRRAQRGQHDQRLAITALNKEAASSRGIGVSLSRSDISEIFCRE